MKMGILNLATLMLFVDIVVVSASCGTNQRLVNSICYDCGAGQVADGAGTACMNCPNGQFKYAAHSLHCVVT
jgi:hypothetical protein